MFCPKCGKEIPDQATFCPKCGASLAGRPSNAAGKKPAKPAKAGKDRKDKPNIELGGKRKLILAAAAAAAVIAILILLPKSPSPTASDATPSTGIAQGQFGDDPAAGAEQGGSDGTQAESTDDAADAVKLGKDGKRSLKGQSKEYKENYNYVFDHQSEIVAAYYQESSAELANNIKGTLNAVRDIVAAVDPKIIDMIAMDAAVDNADSFLGMHLIYSGVNAYFSDSELGRGLRDVSESLILSAVANSYGTGAKAVRKDSLAFCASSMDYALMQTKGTINEIVTQMSVDSGYTSAIPALDWYYNEIFELQSQDIMDDIEIMWNGNGDQEAVQIKWDAFRGRMDAAQDCKQSWNTALKEWTGAFLHDAGIDTDVDALTVEDANKRIYALFDRTGKQHGAFTASDLTNVTILDDGSVIYQEGLNLENANLIKRDIDGNVLASYLNVNLKGYNSLSSYSRLASCGNVLRRTTRSDFEIGDYQVLELVRPDGSAETICEVKTLEGVNPVTNHYYLGPGRNNIGWIPEQMPCSDFFAIECAALEGGHLKQIIDMRTGKTYTTSEYIDQFGDNTQNGTYLNDQYVIDSEYKVYDKDDMSTPVVELSDGGGVSRMFYSEESDQYWVISQTRYYYRLDNNFHRIAEPIKLPDNRLYDFCPFGLIMWQDRDNFALCDENLNVLHTFSDESVIGFMSGDINILTGEPMTLTLKT